MRMLVKLTAQRADRGPLEDSQRTRKGLAKNSGHRDFTEDPQRIHRGLGKDPKRLIDPPN